MSPTTPPDNEAGKSAVDSAVAETGETVEQIPLFDAAVQPTMNIEQPDSANPEEQTPESLPSAAVVASDLLPDMRLPADGTEAPESLGMRLRATREARGMRCVEAAQKLKLPLATIQALEADRYERIGDGIYLRGYLVKYLRLLDLPQVMAERILSAHEQLPALITSGTVSRPRYLFQRYSVSALYLILTGVIIVPAVLLAMRGGFEPNLAQITPLDTPEASAVAPASAPMASSGAATDSITTPIVVAPLPAVTPASDETPLVASLTPFPASKHDASDAGDPDRTATVKTAVTPLPAGAHLLRLSLTVPSWVEIVASDGEKLEFGLLPAGAVRNY